MQKLIVSLPQKEISKHYDSLYTCMKGDSPFPLPEDSKLSVYGLKGIPLREKSPYLEIAHARWDLPCDGSWGNRHSKITTVKGDSPVMISEFIYLPESIVELNIGDSHSLPYSFEDPMQASRITISSIKSYSNSS